VPGCGRASARPGVNVATDRRELTSYEYRQIRARILAASDVCIACGHGAADAVDHIHPASKGGAKRDPDNLAPIHGVKGCPTCLRKCKEWQPGKVDPRGPGVTMPDIRGRVAERLDHPASWSPSAPAPPGTT
jgi:hypothetical protein